jgi:hypothetical protein
MIASSTPARKRVGRPKKQAAPDVAPIMSVRTIYSAKAHAVLLAEQQRRLDLGLGKVPIADIQREWLEAAAAQAAASPAPFPVAA